MRHVNSLVRTRAFFPAREQSPRTLSDHSVGSSIRIAIESSAWRIGRVFINARLVQDKTIDHGDVARIEIAREDLPSALRMEVFDTLSREFKKLGFKFVTLDVDGYRTGALNEVLVQIGK